MDQQTTSQKQTTERGTFLTPLMVDGIAAVSSVAAGGVMFWREVLSESYSNFTSLDLVDDIKRKYRASFGPEISRQIEGGGLNREAAFEKILKQNKEYNVAVAERIEKAGFGSFSSRLKLLNSHEKWKIGLTALAVTAVSLGSVLVISRDLFAKKEQDKSAENQHSSPSL